MFVLHICFRSRKWHSNDHTSHTSDPINIKHRPYSSCRFNPRRPKDPATVTSPLLISGQGKKTGVLLYQVELRDPKELGPERRVSVAAVGFLRQFHFGKVRAGRNATRGPLVLYPASVNGPCHCF